MQSVHYRSLEKERNEMGVIKRALGSGEYSQMANVKIEVKLRDVA